MCVRVSDESVGSWGRTCKKSGVGRTVPYRKAPLAEGERRSKSVKILDSTSQQEKRQIRRNRGRVGSVASHGGS